MYPEALPAKDLQYIIQLLKYNQVNIYVFLLYDEL